MIRLRVKTLEAIVERKSKQQKFNIKIEDNNIYIQSIGIDIKTNIDIIKDLSKMLDAIMEYFYL